MFHDKPFYLLTNAEVLLSPEADTRVLLHAFYDRVLVPVAVRRGVVDEGRGRAGAQAVRQAVEAGTAIFCPTDDQLLRRGREVETEGTAVLTPVELIESIEP